MQAKNNLAVSAYPKSVLLGQMTNLNLSFNAVASIDWFNLYEAVDGRVSSLLLRWKTDSLAS